MRTKSVSRFTVKEFRNRSTISYRVQGYLPDGSRVRENYPDRLRALSRQAELEIESTGAQTEVLITRPVPSFVSQADLDEAVAALRLLKRKAGLLKCADFYLQHYPQSGDKLLSEACAEFLAEKATANLRPHSLRNLKDRIGRFVAAHPDKNICAIRPADIQTAVYLPGWKASTCHNQRRALHAFFNWCVKRGFTGENPVAKVDPPRLERGEPVILSLDEVKALLAASQNYKAGIVTPYLTVSLFGGLRPAELQRVNWADIDVEAKTLVVRGACAKLRARRLLRLPDNLRAQRGYREQIALLLGVKCSEAPARIACCRPWKLCLHPLCRRCNYFLRVAAAQYEFAGVLERAAAGNLSVVALVPSFTFDASLAGLHFVLRRLPNGKPKEFRHERPFGGERDASLLCADGDEAVIAALLAVLKRFPRRLLKLRLITGAFYQPEFKVSYHPGAGRPDNLDVIDAFLPHCNLTVTTDHRPDWRWASACWRQWVELCEEAGAIRQGVAFPDLFVGRRMEQSAELSAWISYSLKAPPYQAWYAEGLKNGCAIASLNHQFSQTAFPTMAAWRADFSGPHKLGDLHPNKPGYLGRQRPPRAKIRELERKLKLVRDGDQNVELTREEFALLDLSISREFLRFQRVIRFLRSQRTAKYSGGSTENAYIGPTEIPTDVD